MRVALGCDHRGITLKQAIMDLLGDMGYETEDLGCYDSSSVDYPDIAKGVAGAVSEGKFEQGILICGTGIGMSMAANKVCGVRAALCRDVLSAHRAREHNDANVLCLSGDILTLDEALEIVKAYFDSHFEGGRHARRVEKMKVMEIENGCPKP